MAVAHRGHFEFGKNSDSSLGSRKMDTFAKLPKIAPRTAERKYFIGEYEWSVLQLSYKKSGLPNIGEAALRLEVQNDLERRPNATADVFMGTANDNAAPVGGALAGVIVKPLANVCDTGCSNVPRRHRDDACAMAC